MYPVVAVTCCLGVLKAVLRLHQCTLGYLQDDKNRRVVHCLECIQG